MSNEFLSQEVDIVFDSKYWDGVMQGQRSNVDACLMDKVGQLHARTMKLANLDLDVKNQFSSNLSLDNVRNKSYFFLAVNMNFVTSL